MFFRYYQIKSWRYAFFQSQEGDCRNITETNGSRIAGKKGGYPWRHAW